MLVACEFSGIVREAFRRKGHDAVSCDLLPSEIPGPHIQGDVREVLDDGWDLMLAFPPCDHLALSGARWWPAKRADGRQQSAVDFVLTLAGADIPRIAIENPVGYLSTAWRKPDQIVQPWQFGCGEVKATCLWLKGLPLLRETYIALGRDPRVHYEPGHTAEGKRNRSRTYPGIASAMANQWGAT